MDKRQKEEITRKVINTLRSIYDPEIPVDIWELGLIYDPNVDNNSNVYVKMTLTAPSCPVAESLPIQVQERIRAIEGVKDVYVDLVWDPPWSMDLMSDEAKLKLGFL